ncbi:MAG: hypothetical protein IPQ00_00075 [Chloracidobacterium sp.]|nr:hypothetical protein [Chloracidobacterium sp.]
MEEAVEEPSDPETLHEDSADDIVQAKAVSGNPRLRNSGLRRGAAG